MTKGEKRMDKLILQNLKNEFKKSIKQHFRTLSEKYPEEDFYGYSLYTSDDVSSIGPVANRVSSLKVDEFDPMYNYYRYSPDEWCDWDDFGMFQLVNEIIAEYYSKLNDNFEQFVQDILEQALQSLYELQSEGLFGVKHDNRFLVVWVSDSGNEIMNTSAKLLNTEKTFKEYALEFMS